MIKADGTFMVWADGGGPVKPLNWMIPPTVVEEERDEAASALTRTLLVRKQRQEDSWRSTIAEVLSDVEHELDTLLALEKEGVERELQELLADAPEWCGEGLRLVRREWPTDIGPVDLMCRDGEDEWIAVEIKRIATIDAVEQLTRYLERIRLDPALGSCRGVLAAQVIKPQARVLAELARDRLRRGRLADAARRTRAGAAAVRRLSQPTAGGGPLGCFGHRAARRVRDEPTSKPPAQPAVLTERRGNVLLITLNRPEVRNAVNAALAEGVAGALDELDGDERCRSACSPAPAGFFSAGMDLGAFVKGESAWFGDRGFAGITQRAVAQAADRRDRGLRAGRRDGDRAGVRPDRRRQGRQAWGSPRSSARSSPPAARCCGCRGGCPTTSSWSWR